MNQLNKTNIRSWVAIEKWHMWADKFLREKTDKHRHRHTHQHVYVYAYACVTLFKGDSVK